VLVGALDVLVPGLYADDVEPIPRPWWRSPWQWLGNVTLTETWRAHLVGDRTGYFIGPIWTLCYEEQFYVVTGALLVLARRWFFAAAGLVSLAVVAVVAACSLRDVDIEGFFFDGSWLMFASGVLIYWGINYRGPAVRAGSLVLFVAVTCWSTFGRSSFEPYVGWRTDHELGVATAFAAILLLTHRWDEPLARARALAPLIAWCGTMCYSLYLVHWPIVKPLANVVSWTGMTGHAFTLFVTVPLCVAVSSVIAWWFHRRVELRFMNTQPPPHPSRIPEPVSGSEVAAARSPATVPVSR
jgi:peptidoglycan/LPS O-acetylase OafA/YrhL